MSKRRPAVFVCVVDVSGSMGEIVGAGELANGLAYSRLDLVKHVLNVIIACLDEKDMLALIAFSDQAELLMSLTPMSNLNKSLAKTAVQMLEPLSSTNTTNGLKMAYELILNSQLEANYLKSIVLLTDGQVLL